MKDFHLKRILSYYALYCSLRDHWLLRISLVIPHNSCLQNPAGRQAHSRPYRARRQDQKLRVCTDAIWTRVLWRCFSWPGSSYLAMFPNMALTSSSAVPMSYPPLKERSLILSAYLPGPTLPTRSMPLRLLLLLVANPRKVMLPSRKRTQGLPNNLLIRGRKFFLS